MNVLLLSYGIKEYDGRLSQLIDVFKNVGIVTSICLSEQNEPDTFCVKNKQYLSTKTYFQYLLYVLKRCSFAKRNNHIDILVSDNLYIAPIGLIINFLIKPRYLVVDSRELYLRDFVRGSLKLFVKAEHILLTKANVCVCANDERAQIMCDEHGLKKTPIVLENIRFLDQTYNQSELDIKYKGVFKHKFNIVSTSGVYFARDTEKLVLAFKKLSDDFGLYFVGNTSEQDLEKLAKIMDAEKIKNIYVLGQVPMHELRYIVNQCQIGAVHYHNRDVNNRYCASGKIYEFLHEGLPLVTTENPPLKNFMNKNKVGISNDDFFEGITEVANNYDEYKANVDEFISSISPETYNKEVSELIMQAIQNERKGN